MNNVVTVKKGKDYVCSALIGDNLRDDRTAFIGTCGSGEHGLYLVTYDCIVKADDPENTWSGSCPLTADEFVNITIKY